jgi:hypothetical protein
MSFSLAFRYRFTATFIELTLIRWSVNPAIDPTSILDAYFWRLTGCVPEGSSLSDIKDEAVWLFPVEPILSSNALKVLSNSESLLCSKITL